MKKKKLKIENIVGIFVIILLTSLFVMSVSAQSSSIPIKLELTAEPSTVEVGETAIITVRLLDENDVPVETEVDIPVSISTNLGSVPSSRIIPAKKDLAETQFTSEVSGIAVISAKSKGLISDTTSIAVVPLPTPTPSPSLSPLPSPTPTHTPTPTHIRGGGGGRRGGGGGGIPDTDGDGYTDIEEMIMGTDPLDPCDPNPECVACVGAIVEEAITEVITERPATPKPKPTIAPTTPEPEPEEPEKEPIPGFGAVFAIAGLLAVAYLVLRRKKE